jgi:branched-chain amino acid transport system substrate-binding protein
VNSEKSEVPLLIGALLITSSIVAGGYWLYSSYNNKDTTAATSSASASASPGSSSSSGGAASVVASDGSSNLVTSEGNNNPAFAAAKEAGITAMKNQEFPKAITEFDKALKIRKNAPETLIYENNAAIGTKPSYTIGVAVPLQSDLDGSLELLRGVAQAQTEINKANGINGVPLRVTIVGEADKAETAVAAAEIFVKDPKVLGVVGHYASDSTLAAGKIYDSNKLVSISAVSSSVKLTGFSNFVFRTIPSDYVSGRALADHALKAMKRQKAVIFFNSASGYSQSLKSEFAAGLALGGGKVVQEFDMNAAGFDGASALAQAKEADVIMLAANTGTLDKAMTVVQANAKKLPMLGGDDVYAPKTLESGKAQAAGLVVAVPWHIEAQPNGAFNKSSQQFWQASVNWRTALAYDATQVFAAALKASPSPTRQSVRDAMAASTFKAPGAAGDVSFLPSGDRSANVQLVQVAPGQKSGKGFDFVPIK